MIRPCLLVQPQLPYDPPYLLLPSMVSWTDIAKAIQQCVDYDGGIGGIIGVNMIMTRLDTRDPRIRRRVTGMVSDYNLGIIEMVLRERLADRRSRYCSRRAHKVPRTRGEKMVAAVLARSTAK